MQIAQHLEGAGAALCNLLDAEWPVGRQGTAVGGKRTFWAGAHAEGKAAGLRWFLPMPSRFG